MSDGTVKTSQSLGAHRLPSDDTEPASPLTPAQPPELPSDPLPDGFDAWSELTVWRTDKRGMRGGNRELRSQADYEALLRSEPGTRVVLQHGDYTLQVPEPPPLQRERDLTEVAVNENRFCWWRGVVEYQEVLGAAFRDDLATWTSSTRVLDAGAGAAYFFHEWLEQCERDGRAPPELVAASAARPHGAQYRALPPTKSGLRTDRPFQYEEGLFATDGALEAKLGLGTFDRCLCVFGPAHYADLDRILESYASLLREGGLCFLHLDTLGEYLSLEDAQGNRVSVEDYLARVSGFEVVRVSESKTKVEGHQAFTLRRTNVWPKAPALQALRHEHTEPPKRAFRIVE